MREIKPAQRMADLARNGPVERDIEQAITALKKGAQLLKYGRRGKPKFCPFRLSNDEGALIWFSGKEEKQLRLSAVARIVPGQRTAIFQRYPRPEKEYQSFSLIYGERSLDLICKDKDEAEVWILGLKALVTAGVQQRRPRADNRTDIPSDTTSPISRTRISSPLTSPFSSGESLHQDHSGDTFKVLSPFGSPPRYDKTLEKSFSAGALVVGDSKNYFDSGSLGGSMHSAGSDLSSDNLMNMKGGGPPIDAFRVSMSSAVSSSSQGSGQEENEALGDVFMWGEGMGDGFLGGGVHKLSSASGGKMDALLPKALESAVVLDVQNIACGGRHAALVTKQGEVFSWGEESGGRLGHGVDCDVPHPKLVEALATINTEFVSCGEYHSCAVSLAGDLYTWGDGTHNFGLLGHGNDISHWMPKRVNGLLEGIRVSSIACGPWHTALVTSAGQLFTFGDGTFGVLGHNDTKSAYSPREVESLKGLKTVRAACGVWHTAAVVEVMVGYSSASSCSSGKLFTWGDGDKGRLGHGDKEQRLVPTCVAALVDYNFKQVACGHSLTVALTTMGQVFTMGSRDYGQLGDPEADGKIPGMVEGKLYEVFVEEISCGSHHVAVMTHKTEVYTWGKGAHGRLGHGDERDRLVPTLVEALKDKQVKNIACGSSFTAAICLHKWVSGADQSVCSGCKQPFGFTRKRHNCYNCGLVYCHSCSSKKALRASLAPSHSKPYRVCDPCHSKLKKAAEAGPSTPAVLAKRATLKTMRSIDKDKSEKGEKSTKPGLSSKPPVEQPKAMEGGKMPPRRPKKSDVSSSRVSPAPNGMMPWGSVNVPPTFNTGFFQPKIIALATSLSVPQSRNLSRAVSPLSRRSSPPRSTTPTPTITGLTIPKTVVDDLKKTNEALSEEVLKLRAQVENYTRRCQNQEKELQRYMQQVREANAIAGEETAKSRAAKEVIKSLTAQLRDLAERLPPGSIRRPGAVTVRHDIPNGTHPPAVPDQLVPSEVEGTQNHIKKYHITPTSPSLRDGDMNGGTSPHSSSSPRSTVQASPRSLDGSGSQGSRRQIALRPSESDINGLDLGQRNEESGRTIVSAPTENGREERAESEWVEQDEPGVYITLTALPGGGKDLKRVRFSRKRFSERQAELWWAENRQRVHEQYNVRGMDRPNAGMNPPSRPEEEERIDPTHQNPLH
ncbi:hypothetical protein MPTK1_1g24610 [Marchantia polymorpha subsp. ruderalis]|uniref:FYVE-type domain-containing protein n=3 Tax=Marchantia polymorpha TaxID=3197 RepID=A0AAF6ATW1_MARPO|nr:hypothetical protein MARPO_0061s0061 [Marchantia polymorpha]BBM99881.1 hypothetical protein Mp_1g24610 [Marchantia polymorpha subsp. ruderalis]|eukprot:PTQ36804.1 hypothetical protein MARPO_0061s0061 [Marchantia polymorpha]